MTINQILVTMALVVFVGVLVLAGIQVYKHQVYTANQKSLEMDMDNFCAQIFVYMKTPYVGGGAGQQMSLVKKENLVEFVGFSHVNDPIKKADYYSIFTNNGEIRLVNITRNTIVLCGLGKVSNNGNYAKIQSTINLYTYVITKTMSSAKSL